MDINNIESLEAIIEGVLFAAGDAVPLDRISEIIEVDKRTTKIILNNLISKYQNSQRGIMLREINNAFQLCTRIEHNEYIKKLFEPRQRQGLSQAAFEVLAIVAYNKPITRAKIEQIRGVNSDSAISKLIERNLIKEAGRLDSPGKPMLYESTEEFLRSFGFKSIADLPRLDDEENIFNIKEGVLSEKTEIDEELV